MEKIPTIKQEGLRGGVVYYDGQFDDSRLLINLVSTAVEHGATMVNYAPVIAMSKDDEGYVNGVTFKDLETGKEHAAQAKVVINATGAFTDRVRRLADPDVQAMIAPSQGIHLVFDRSLMPGDSAIMVPHTSDGRVMFAIPWHSHIVVGTTDTPIEEASLEPVPFEHEIEFILETAGKYLSRPPARADVLSVFVGIRPLVKAGGGGSTAALSRDHTIHIDNSGLLTICGGKWTTYRHMSEEAVDHAITLARLDEKPCVTKELKIHGHREFAPELGHMYVYGADVDVIRELINNDKALGEPLNPALPYTTAELVWSCRHEMARTPEDFLARRTRALFLNARAASEMAPKVVEVMATELQKDAQWKKDELSKFQELAKQYMLVDSLAGTAAV